MKTKQTFKEHLRKSNLSENTITSYLWTVNYFHSHYDEVNKENLLAYKGYLMEFFKPKTVNLRIQGINRWRAEKDRHDYLVEQKIASGYTTFSYSSIYSEDEDVTGEEMLQDEECDVEETAIHNLSLADMRQAINSLNSEEKKLISILLDYEMNITLSRLSELMGLTFEQTRYMRDCAYAKIRSFMGE